MGGTTPPPRKTPPEGRSEPHADDRPTLVPDFNPEDFARDSEMRRRAASAAGGEPTIDEARRLHSEGDHERALFLLSRLLDLAPLHPEATRLASDCRTALERQCSSAIGSESSTLVAAVSSEELKGFALDSVSAFLISLMDGATNVERSSTSADSRACSRCGTCATCSSVGSWPWGPA